MSDISSLQTLPELFSWRVTQTPELEAYRQFEIASQTWVSYSWLATQQRIAIFSQALTGAALERGARVAILLPNGLDAVCLDQAILQKACVPVPMHALDNPASIAYILQDSDASLLVANSDEQWSAIESSGVTFPALRQVIVLQKNASKPVNHEDIPVVTLSDWLAQANNQPISIEALPTADDLAALVYTSGTTGKPKGVMLTHRNILSNVQAVVQRVSPLTSDVFLSFLPFSHTFERTAGYYLPIAAGSCVAFSRSTKQLPEDLTLVKPTILISVPRIYERVYSVIQSKLAESAVQTFMFNAAASVGWRRFARSQSLLVDGTWSKIKDALAWQVLNPLVANKLKNQFGGRIRVAVSGGAALSANIAHCFLGLGIPIIQGYGMTETSPVVSFNAPDDNDPSTVGRAMTNVEVRIGENAELQVRGPNVMRGYWKREADTVKTFIDGWLRTGDQAEIVAGRVRILGRIKEIIVTSTGEKVSPVDLELAIANDSAFEQVYVFGDNVPFISCAVVLSRHYWAALAEQCKVDVNDIKSLLAANVLDAVLQKVRDATTSFPYYAQPKAVIATLEPWTIENTLITPTLKLKRNNLTNYFAEDIKRLYAPRS